MTLRRTDETPETSTTAYSRGNAFFQTRGTPQLTKPPKRRVSLVSSVRDCPASLEAHEGFGGFVGWVPLRFHEPRFLGEQSPLAKCRRRPRAAPWGIPTHAIAPVGRFVGSGARILVGIAHDA